MQNFDNNIGFWEKRQFFRRKLSKIGENCDHNIDPRSPWRFTKWMPGQSDEGREGQGRVQPVEEKVEVVGTE
jgi:hypothetical protein